MRFGHLRLQINDINTNMEQHPRLQINDINTNIGTIHTCEIMLAAVPVHPLTYHNALS